MVLAKGQRSRSRYCWAGTDKVASRAVCTLEVCVWTAFVVSFASAMQQLECKRGVSGVSPLIPLNNDWRAFFGIATFKDSARDSCVVASQR